MSDTFEEATGMSSEAGDGLVIDLSGVNEKGTFLPIPRGLYPATVAQLDFGMSNRSQNPMWTWIFEIDGGEFAGRKLFYHTVFNEGGMPRVKRTLARIRSDGDYQNELLKARFSPEAVANEGRLLGARCRLRVDQRPYEGTMRNEIKDVLPPDGSSDSGFAGV